MYLDIDLSYAKLVNRVLAGGVKDDVNDCKFIFGANIEHDFSTGFPIITTKKIRFKQVLTEVLWCLKGDSNIKYLVDNNCSIWNMEAYNYYKRVLLTYNCPEEPLTYLNFILKIKNSTIEELDNYFNLPYNLGDLGPIQNKQWRNFNGEDQLVTIIDDLVNYKESSSLIVTSWNPSELEESAYRPNQTFFQLSHRNGYLDLIWNEGYVDLYSWLPNNISFYGLLLQLFCELSNLKPGKIRGQLGRVFIQNDHIELIKKQISKEPIECEPILAFDDNSIDILSEFYGASTEQLTSLLSKIELEDITLLDYKINKHEKSIPEIRQRAIFCQK